MLCGRLQRRPTVKEAASCELLPCGVIIITDAMTVAAEPAALKRVRETPLLPPRPRFDDVIAPLDHCSLAVCASFFPSMASRHGR